ncbi:MAG: hypothetical protein SPI03_01445 [Campylobacter sputorum]|uniref:hypothetical protein n=1 Tax=Campylobacter sputorum TaxID=206 RepID=UPI002A91FA0A|nr:hypothetical protein [Campylobacter sputorum]MDY6119995.1 hypothetical protein [Campylobacter sputorum]
MSFLLWGWSINLYCLVFMIVVLKSLCIVLKNKKQVKFGVFLFITLVPYLMVVMFVFIMSMFVKFGFDKDKIKIWLEN